MYMRVQFLNDFARSDWQGRGLGAFMTVKGPHDRKRERLSEDYAVKFLNHVRLKAELHATSTFLAAKPKRSKPGNATSSPQGELMIGRIEEESLNGDTGSVVALIHFRDYPVTRSQFTLRRCDGEWKIDGVNLFYKDVFDLRNDMCSERQFASLNCNFVAKNLNRAAKTVQYGKETLFNRNSKFEAIFVTEKTNLRAGVDFG